MEMGLSKGRLPFPLKDADGEPIKGVMETYVREKRIKNKGCPSKIVVFVCHKKAEHTDKPVTTTTV